MEVLANIHQLKIPLPNNPLGSVNAYLVKTSQGGLLIDTGWNTAEAFDALQRQLEEAQTSLDDLKYIVITHIHPDHYGLVGRLEKLTPAKLIIHELERALLVPRYIDYTPLLAEMERWLAVNGVPDEARPGMQFASMEILGLVEVAMPDVVVRGGEHLALGDFDFELHWTPGHAPGHICLYERSRKILFSGDHVLAKTTPNVSLNGAADGNPLGDYRESLRRIAQLPVEHVLPGHGAVFSNLVGRIETIQRHHDERLEEMLAILRGGAMTGYQVALAVKWYLPWLELRAFQKRMAVTETLAHLELLARRGALVKSERDGGVWFSLA